MCDEGTKKPETWLFLFLEFTLPIAGGKKKKKEFVSSLFYNDKTLAADFLPCKAYVTI